jgi:hypothetical protein
MILFSTHLTRRLFPFCWVNNLFCIILWKIWFSLTCCSHWPCAVIALWLW